MTKLMMILAIAGSAVAFVPEPAAAASCTEEYAQCLNDSWALQAALRTLADVECFAEYAGCVRRSLLGA
jgi:hypothetical protein